MNSACADYFDWLINEREPYPTKLSRELVLSENTGRHCPINRGPTVVLSSESKKECVTDG